MAPVLKIAYEPITSKNIDELKRLNATAFPIKYPEAFYKKIIDQKDMGLSKLAYWRSNLVGAICTCISAEEEGDNGNKIVATSASNLCIMTLAVYAPYRGRGIGSELLQSVLEYCPQKSITTVTLHVHVSNQDAIRFYKDRFGFESEALLENYYRRLVPPHCYKLSKKLFADKLRPQGKSIGKGGTKQNEKTADEQPSA